jgi:hypothetical protein
MRKPPSAQDPLLAVLARAYVRELEPVRELDRPMYSSSSGSFEAVSALSVVAGNASSSKSSLLMV